MEIKIPQSLKTEHEELHDELRKAIKYGGKVGDAAKAVANVLHDPAAILVGEYLKLQN